MNSKTGQKDYLTPNEVAEIYGFSKDLLYIWRAEGIGPRFFQYRATIRYARKDLDKFIKTNTHKTLEMDSEQYNSHL